MTEKQITRAVKLREMGMGISGIARMLGVPRDKVRYQLKDVEPKEEVNASEMEAEMEGGKRCLFCGRQLAPGSTGRPRKFCSEECRRGYWHTNAEKGTKRTSAVYTKKCAWCGEIFTAYGNKGRKYCCHGHYVMDRFGERKNLEKQGETSTSGVD